MRRGTDDIGHSCASTRCGDVANAGVKFHTGVGDVAAPGAGTGVADVVGAAPHAASVAMISSAEKRVRGFVIGNRIGRVRLLPPRTPAPTRQATTPPIR